MITDNAFITITIVWIILHMSCHLVYALVNDKIFATEKILPLEGQVRQRVLYCSSFDYQGLFYIPHIIIAVVLCLLAFSIRKIKLKQFNDAANIAIFFYTTAPVVGLCGTLLYIFSPANDVYHMATGSLILNCVFVCCIVFMCQLTLFVPKMLPLFRQWRIHYCHRWWYNYDLYFAVNSHFYLCVFIATKWIFICFQKLVLFAFVYIGMPFRLQMNSSPMPLQWWVNILIC